MTTALRKREKVNEFINKLMEYDVISFDIFDTLILRSLSDPKDVFAFLATQYSLLDFGKNRVAVEQKLRREKQEQFNTREVTIHEIYEELYKLTSIEPSVGIRNELEMEKKFCYANPYMKLVFDTLLQNGKKVIITSDMYLPHCLMEELLEKCGYTGYSNLFVSCDYLCSKSDMQLYKYIQKKYINRGKKVIHIGDNYQSDYLNAQEIGWDAYHYPQVKAIGKPFNKIGMSFITGSYFSAIVNNHLYNGIEQGYPYNQMSYKYGFMYGGILILGYVNWIHRKAVENKMDKVIFLARDGYILKKVYDMLYKDIPSEYALWSRHASMKTSLKTNLEAYIWQFIRRRRDKNPNITVGNILKDMEFDCLINKLDDVSLDVNDKIGDENIEEDLTLLIMQNCDEVKKVSEKYSEASKKYYKDIIGDAKKVYMVDIGWRGSGALSLKYLFENEWKFDCQVKALVAGTYKIMGNRDAEFQTNKDIESYMFSADHNTDLLLKHQSKILLNNTIIEIFTTAPTPSFLSVCLDENDNYKFAFDISEIENSEKINLIFKGELDFIKQYLKYSKDFPELLSISGRDAYLPFNFLMEGKRLENFKKAFNEFSFNSLIGGIKDDNGADFETFGEVCEKIERGG